MSQAKPGSEQGLVCAIGVRGLTANVVNTTVGAGIFVLPALVARDLGSAAPLAYLACAIAMTFVVASFAMAGSRVSLTGGIYAYVEVAFGPFVGFLTGFLLWLSCILAAASVASALASSVALLVPAFDLAILRAILLALVLAALASVNVRGAAMGTRLIEIATLVKLLPLLLLTGAGLFWVRSEHLAIEWVAPERIGTASLTLIFAFQGIEVALLPSGEVRDPARTVPRAVFLALGLTTLLYLLLQLVAHAVLGPALGSFVDAPLAEVASRVLGPVGRTMVLIGASISMLGFLSSDALCTPRSLYAFARDGLVPAPLARLHPRFRTPWLAILVHAGLVWALAAVGSFGVLALLANVAVLWSYLLCCLAAIELRRRNVQAGGRPFVLPGGPLVPGLACMVMLWLLSHASLQEFAVTGGAVVVAALLFAWRSLRTPTLLVDPPDEPVVGGL
ncbi:MAG TPA: APC family permease [Vicinamibacterales bacterium]|jgi:amino acid transporter|nr:APC family permease [Vicinamibacterales bacterium]